MEKRMIKGVYAISILLLFIAAKWDLAISFALYQPSTGWACFLQDGYPIILKFCLACCFLLLMDRKHCYFIIAVFLADFFALYDLSAFFSYPIWSWYSLFCCSLFLILQWCLYQIMTPWHRKKAKKYIVFFLQVFFAVFLIVTVMKCLWSRTRYRDLEQMTQFCSWYIPCRQGGTSFPSGHTSSFAAALLSLYTIISNIRKHRSIWLMFIVWFLIALMMISRIIMGAHFLSDTAAGMMIAVLCWQFIENKWRNRLNECT